MKTNERHNELFSCPKCEKKVITYGMKLKLRYTLGNLLYSLYSREVNRHCPECGTVLNLKYTLSAKLLNIALCIIALALMFIFNSKTVRNIITLGYTITAVLLDRFYCKPTAKIVIDNKWYVNRH